MTLVNTMSARSASLRAASTPSAPVQAVSQATASRHTASIFGKSQKFWVQHREASLNWLALGLLLAAWNAADGDEPSARPRPDSLRGYAAVSVRAVQQSTERFNDISRAGKL